MLWNRKKQVGQQALKGSMEKQFNKLSFGLRTPPTMPTSSKNQVGAGQLKGLSTSDQIFMLSLKDSISPTDPAQSHVWQYNIPVISSNEKKLIMEVQGGQLTIINLPTAQFPLQMYLYCDSMPGYLDNNADPTHIIAIYRIKSLVPCVVGATVTYTIIYSVQDLITWDMGTNRNLLFKFGDENGPYVLPLAQSVNFQFKIIHVAY